MRGLERDFDKCDCDCVAGSTCQSAMAKSGRWRVLKLCNVPLGGGRKKNKEDCATVIALASRLFYFMGLRLAKQKKNTTRPQQNKRRTSTAGARPNVMDTSFHAPRVRPREVEDSPRLCMPFNVSMDLARAYVSVFFNAQPCVHTPMSGDAYTERAWWIVACVCLAWICMRVRVSYMDLYVCVSFIMDCVCMPVLFPLLHRVQTKTKSWTYLNVA